jgi:hypothetical protein
VQHPARPARTRTHRHTHTHTDTHTHANTHLQGRLRRLPLRLLLPLSTGRLHLPLELRPPLLQALALLLLLLPALLLC